MVEVSALNIDATTAQNMGAALQHGARPCVGKRDGHARQLAFKFRLGLNGGAFTATDRLQQQPVLIQAVWRQRGDVVGGATSKVGADGLLGPVLGLTVRKRDGCFEFVSLLRRCASERRTIAEFKGVKHNGTVLRAVDLCGTQRWTHRQRANHFSQHARLVAFANDGPLAAVITVQRQVQRLTRRARGDDGAQVVCHLGCGRVFEVHARHLRHKPRNDFLRGTLEALAKVTGEHRWIRDDVDRCGAGGGGYCWMCRGHFVVHTTGDAEIGRGSLESTPE